MSTFLFVFSIICFIAAYGTHMFAKNNPMGWCGYMSVPWMSAIPWISGFVLAVIPEVQLFNIYWLWMFLINLFVVSALGPIITKFFLRRFASGKGAGFDIIIAVVLGVAFLLIGLLVK